MAISHNRIHNKTRKVKPNHTELYHNTLDKTTKQQNNPTNQIYAILQKLRHTAMKISHKTAEICCDSIIILKNTTQESDTTT